MVKQLKPHQVNANKWKYRLDEMSIKQILRYYNIPDKYINLPDLYWRLKI